MMSTSTITVDIERACQIWEEYQRQHDVSDRIGQTVGIDPVSGHIWFGESGVDISGKWRRKGLLRLSTWCVLVMTTMCVREDTGDCRHGNR